MEWWNVLGWLFVGVVAFSLLLALLYLFALWRTTRTASGEWWDEYVRRQAIRECLLVIHDEVHRNHHAGATSPLMIHATPLLREMAALDPEIRVPWEYVSCAVCGHNLHWLYGACRQNLGCVEPYSDEQCGDDQHPHFTVCECKTGVLAGS